MLTHTMSFVAAFVLVACEPVSEPPSPPVPASSFVEIPKYVWDTRFNQALAIHIANECRAFVFNSRQASAEMSAGISRAKEDGVSETQLGEFANNLQDRRIQDDAIAYISKRQIVIVQKETWCSAGRAEIAEGTQIGRFLRERG